MQVDRFAAAGQLLFGDRWQCSVARLLGVSDRIVRRWVAGHKPIPPWVPGKLEVALRARVAEIHDHLALEGSA